MPPARPGREHDTTCARAHGLIDALNRSAATLGIPTLTDLGHENAADASDTRSRSPKVVNYPKPPRRSTR